MKKLVLGLLLVPTIGLSQLNITQIGHLDINSAHGVGLNDIWGYVDTTGVEYAIVGTTDGTSVVSLADPANPAEVYWMPGKNSVWRDIKTWDKYAYVTTEAAQGLLIMNLSTLPNAAGIDTTHWFENGTPLDSHYSAHNLYIDSSGYLYLFGSNKGVGGVRILDLNTDPWNPTEVGSFENWYVHDGVVYDDTMYLGHISDGFLSVVDVTNKSAPALLGTINTPSNFTHNVWINDDHTAAFTTDEVSGGFVAAIDISDPSNMSELDRIQSSPGEGIIPHNAHFTNDYIITSYYTDGVVIHDVSNPSNMIEVGNFDSSPYSGGSFNGVWGAYPWLPSGNLIISDREGGLFVLGPTYVRGCYLDGTVTDQVTTFPIPNAKIEIITHNQLEFSGLTGFYEAGVPTAGTYDVAYSKPAYFPDTAFGLALTNGNLVTQNMALVPKTPFTFVVRVEESGTGTPLENAAVHVFNQDFDYNVTTDVAGYTSITPFYEDNYEIAAGHWGHVTVCLQPTYYDSINDTVVIQLDAGYFDDFAVDLGWTVVDSTQTGGWERVVPVGTGNNGQSNPGYDALYDCYDLCYVTGNGGMNPDHDDVDEGYTTLHSPMMDLSGMTDPYVNYAYWWFTNWGPYPLDDSMFVYLEDDQNNVFMLDTVTWADTLEMSQWLVGSFRVLDYTTLADSLSLNVYIADLDTFVNVTEGGIDRFFVSEGDPTGIVSPKSDFAVNVYPNPASTEIYWTANSQIEEVRVFDLSGKQVLHRHNTSNMPLNISPLSDGVYILRFVDRSGQEAVLKFVKSQ